MNQRSKRLIVIGLDGVSLDLLMRLSIKKGFSNIKEILENGFACTMRSVIPYTTLPAWTSAFTGVNPGKHGITDFIIKVNDEYRLAFSKYREVPSIWKILSQHGIKQIVVNEPVTYPPEKINGIMVSGMMTPYGKRDFVFPSKLIEELSSFFSEYLPDLPPGHEVILKRSPRLWLDYVNKIRDKNIAVFKNLIDRFSWDLAVVIITSTDRILHYFFHKKNILENHFRYIDKLIGFCIEIVKNDNNTNLLLISDHGFERIKMFFNINAYLEGKGLLVRNRNLFSRLSNRFSHSIYVIQKLNLINKLSNLRMYLPSKFLAKIISDIEGSNINFKKSKAYMLSQGVYVANKLYEPLVFNTLLTLSKFSNFSPLKRIFRRNEVIWGPFVSRAPDILLIPNNGVEIIKSSSCNIIEFFGKGKILRSGTHNIRGMFIGYGPDFKKVDSTVEEKFSLNIYDVAPFILYYFNIPIPRYFDGKIKKEILSESSTLRKKPVKIGHINLDLRYKIKMKLVSSKKIYRDN